MVVKWLCKVDKMEYKFEGKTALVTGAGKGELAESLLCAAAALGG